MHVCIYFECKIANHIIVTTTVQWNSLSFLLFIFIFINLFMYCIYILYIYVCMYVYSVYI